MIPADFNRIRQAKGLSIAQMARILRIADRSTVHRWATGERNISGPASILLEMLERGELPARYLGEPIPARCKEDWTRNFTRDTIADSDGDDGA
jgi:transcriptional regulator with XRE-family HTH domain